MDVQTRILCAALVAALFSVAPPAVAVAQQPPPPPARDSVPADSAAAADTVVRREPPADPRADSIIGVLRRLRGYTATEYLGDSATFRADEGVLRLRGNAEVAREGERLTADSIIFRDRVDLVEAYGRPTVTGQAQELTGDVLYYDLTRRRAVALGARTKVTETATWFVTGDLTSELEGTGTLYASHAQFTTCDLEIPHYHFEADRIKIVRDRYLVARPARLYFGKVPVMVLPFVVQNLERGRRSGLVVPRFSINDIVRTNSNYTREISDVGWYWAINEYIGAQITGTWRSESYTALQASTDFRWRRQFLDGRASFQRYWREDGRRELALSANSSWRPDERSNLQLSANYASSSEFVREATYDPRESTQDLRSTFGLTRRFDWGQVGFSANRSQSIADGSTTMTLPRLSISPQAITLFRAPTAEQERWFSNSTLQWTFNGERTTTDPGEIDARNPLRDRAETRIDAGITQLSVGNLNLSATANLNQTLLRALRIDDVEQGQEPVNFPEERADRGRWQASIGYQQRLIGQTTLSPNIGLSQEFVRDTATADQFVTAPTRMNVGASLGTALFGFFPGVGPYTAIRHRLSPAVSYSYSPEVQQSALQERAFGRITGRAQNTVSLSLSQSFEAKLRPREVRQQEEERLATVQDTAGLDTAAVAAGAERPRGAPADPEKVTILSINTDAISYDFVRASETGTGFTTERLGNTLTSDYLKGLTIRVEHELFDRSELNPREPGNEGRLGRFAPRLSQLSTGFELGPNTALIAVLNRLLGWTGEDVENEAVQGVFPGNAPASGSVNPTGAATNNPQGTGAGPWNVGVRYSFTRDPRLFQGSTLFPRDDRAIQTMSLDARFALTPNWGVSWTTDYSITDREFGTHNLRFTRDLHRWQANFNFYKTPTGNSAFEFYVELIDNRDLKLDYRERNLGIDRERR